MHIMGCGCIAHCTHPHPLFPFHGGPLIPLSIQWKGRGYPPALCHSLEATSLLQGLDTHCCLSFLSPQLGPGPREMD